jgi:hypothetical protein
MGIEKEKQAWETVDRHIFQACRCGYTLRVTWYGMVKLYLNTLASINVSCFS